MKEAPDERQRIFGEILSRAKSGKYLQVSPRPEQRLRVDSVTRSDMSALRWIDDAQITFTAYLCPWWENIRKTIAKAAEEGKNGSISLLNNGNVPTPLEVTAKAIEPITTFTVSCGSEKITLNNLTVASGEEIKIDHNEDGIQSITAAGESAIASRNGQSSDEIMLKRGINKIAFSGDGKMIVTVKARGRYY